MYISSERLHLISDADQSRRVGVCIQLVLVLTEISLGLRVGCSLEELLVLRRKQLRVLIQNQVVEDIRSASHLLILVKLGDGDGFLRVNEPALDK